MTDNEYKLNENRARQFYAKLLTQFIEDERPFTGTVASSHDPVSYDNRLKLKYLRLSENQVWGGPWESAWMHLEGTIPAAWRGRPVLCHLAVGGEGLIFDAEGVPCYSLTNTCAFDHNFRKEFFRLTDKAAPGKFDLWIETAANTLFGAAHDETCPEHARLCGRAEVLRYGLFREEVWALRLDVEVVMGLLHIARMADDPAKCDSPAFPRGSARERQVMAALMRAIDAYADDPANATAARAVLKEVLGKPALKSAMTVTAVGHAHIDTGWLWPVRETRRKCARTFASQLFLMDRYPDYCFGASQAQQYQFMKEDYPKLYERIKRRVKEGRWELQGGMWVEADCNLASGESFIRQFLHGKNFFKKEFGVEVRNMWLPDVFGYSAALPQIITKCGCDRFLTQKMSWSETNHFPFNCFHWVGIDGTSILSFFPPESTYNATLMPSLLNFGVNNFPENDFINESLSLFGIGDGGGGPKEEYIERGLRCANLEGCPKVRFGRADKFLEGLGKYADQLPSWHGELYLEKHRGTLTTQAKVKRGNRKCEEALQATEALYVLLGAKYPAAELDRLWKLTLLNQFHDILPGSSIAWVYKTTHQEHAEILAACDKLQKSLGGKDKEWCTFVNTLDVPFWGLVALPDGWAGAEQCLCQKAADGTVLALVAVDALGTLALKRSQEPAPAGKAAAFRQGAVVLENEWLRCTVDDKGRLLSLVEVPSGREFLSAPANILSLYVDTPRSDDAWDIDLDYSRNRLPIEPQEVQAKAVKGPGFQECTFTYRLGNSTVTQTIRLAGVSPRLDFITHVDWHESHRMLRAAFPVAVDANARANYDIQYGFLERPTHSNTSWDQARFEVCMHKFVDLGTEQGGVALLNDCKYGVRVTPGLIDINLLRSPKYPDDTADQGEHDFTYSLMPHQDDFRYVGVQTEAACLNRAPVRLAGKVAPKTRLALKCEEIDNNSSPVTIETVKQAEDGKGVILRIVERHGRNSSALLTLPKGVTQVAEQDMIEWRTLRELPVVDGAVALALKPFEILTLRLK